MAQQQLILEIKADIQDINKKIAQLKDKISKLDVNVSVKGVKKAISEADKLSSELNKLSNKKVTADTSGLVAALRRVGIELYGLYQSFRLLNGIINDFLDTSNKTQRALVTLSQFYTNERQAFNQLLTLTTRIPVSFENILNSAVKLKTAGIEPLDGSLEKLAQAVLLAGGTGEDLEYAALAIQQMAGKGTLSLEELRGQLGERIPKAVQIMAEALGYSNIQQFFKDVEKGAIDSSTAIQAFFSKLDTKQLNKFQNNIEGAFARLRAEIQKFYIELGQEGIWDGLVEAIDTIIQIFRYLKESQVIQGAIILLGILAQAVLKVTEWISGGLALAVKFITNAFIALFSAVMTAVSALKLLWSTMKGDKEEAKKALAEIREQALITKQAIDNAFNLQKKETAKTQIQKASVQVVNVKAPDFQNIERRTQFIIRQKQIETEYIKKLNEVQVKSEDERLDAISKNTQAEIQLEKTKIAAYAEALKEYEKYAKQLKAKIKATQGLIATEKDAQKIRALKNALAGYKKQLEDLQKTKIDQVNQKIYESITRIKMLEIDSYRERKTALENFLSEAERDYLNYARRISQIEIEKNKQILSLEQQKNRILKQLQEKTQVKIPEKIEYKEFDKGVLLKTRLPAETAAYTAVYEAENKIQQLERLKQKIQDIYSKPVLTEKDQIQLERLKAEYNQKKNEALQAIEAEKEAVIKLRQQYELLEKKIGKRIIRTDFVFDIKQQFEKLKEIETDISAAAIENTKKLQDSMKTRIEELKRQLSQLKISPQIDTKGLKENLDNFFSGYEIPVKAKISIPDKLNIDVSEFENSIVSAFNSASKQLNDFYNQLKKISDVKVSISLDTQKALSDYRNFVKFLQSVPVVIPTVLKQPTNIGNFREGGI